LSAADNVRPDVPALAEGIRVGVTLPATPAQNEEGDPPLKNVEMTLIVVEVLVVAAKLLLLTVK
jgi:hypothetical protein